MSHLITHYTVTLGDMGTLAVQWSAQAKGVFPLDEDGNDTTGGVFPAPPKDAEEVIARSKNPDPFLAKRSALLKMIESPPDTWDVATIDPSWSVVAD